MDLVHMDFEILEENLSSIPTLALCCQNSNFSGCGLKFALPVFDAGNRDYFAYKLPQNRGLSQDHLLHLWLRPTNSLQYMRFGQIQKFAAFW